MKLYILSILFILFIFQSNSFSQDTFSITAIDPVTGEVGSAGASCVTDVTILTDVHPGWGVIHTQAYYLVANQNYARTLMNKHYSPGQILDSLIHHDAENNPTKRQYGIIDITGGVIRDTAYTGTNCDNYKNHIIGPNFTIQGNILLGQQILDSMKARFLREPGPLAKKLMAALQGAKVVGADTRCASRNTSSESAFIRVAKPGDTLGTLFLSLKVLNAPVNRDPIDSLQVLFNQWYLTNLRNINLIAPDKISLLQNYPNPFNPETSIRFGINKSSMVSLIIYNVLGEEVKILVNENLSSGTYEISWLADNNPSGVYYYRLQAGDYIETKKMLLLK
jgi:uncharacterized Ntn-hydrolase superfamily protein